MGVGMRSVIHGFYECNHMNVINTSSSGHDDRVTNDVMLRGGSL